MSTDQEACFTPDLYSSGSIEGNWVSQTPTPELLATDTEQQQQHTLISRRRQTVREIHRNLSRAFKRVVSFALPSRSKNQAQQYLQPVDPPTNLNHQSLVQPLKVVDRVGGRSLHRSSPSSARRPATMMTEARELFENYGIDRPPG